MACFRKLSSEAKNYLACFYQILDKMVHDMTSAELTDSISHNFIVQMIPHHKAAIEMSRNLLQYTSFVPLQNIASNIIKEQTKSIDNMKTALSCCSQLCSSEQELCLYQRRFQCITQTMFADMENSCASNNINSLFIHEMIPHHRGAIQMSENALRFPLCPELVPILNSIIISQRAGIRKMNHLLQCIQ